MTVVSKYAIALLICLGWFSAASAEDFSYEEIAKRYPAEQLSAADVKEARMHGECLVGLKALNFRSSENFDPVAEWTSYRTLSLLEQFPPCKVLIMLEVARKELLEALAEEESLK